LDPTSKSVRVANYLATLRRDLLKVAEACGVEHPALITPGDIELLQSGTTVELASAYGYEDGWGLPSAHDRRRTADLMAATAPQGGSAPPSSTAPG
jgi:hypothetical protein